MPKSLLLSSPARSSSGGWPVVDHPGPQPLCTLQPSPSPLGPSIILASVVGPNPQLSFTSQANVVVLSDKTFKFPAHHILKPGFRSRPAVCLPADIHNGHGLHSRNIHMQRLPHARSIRPSQLGAHLRLHRQSQTEREQCPPQLRGGTPPARLGKPASKYSTRSVHQQAVIGSTRPSRNKLSRSSTHHE